MSYRTTSGWNRTRATAAGFALLLHAGLAAWLLSVRWVRQDVVVFEPEPIWMPLPPSTRPAAPPPLDRPPRTVPKPFVPGPAPLPETHLPQVLPDWYGAGRDVAGAIGGGPGQRTFGEFPEAPAKRPKEEAPPSIWQKPLPRVGTTVTTPEGETILWVSDYCYVSLGTRSLTLENIHKAREGVRTCVLIQFGGEKKARDDLFDPITRPPPPQQEPGCEPGSESQSCSP